MLTLNINELVIVLDQKTGQQTNAKKLMQFAGTIVAFQKIDGLAYQR